MSLIIKTQLRGSYVADPPIMTGIAVGPFICFQEGSSWNVTHAVLGVRLKGDCCCVLSAVLVAEAATPLTNWERSFETIVDSADGKAIKKAVRAVICPTHDREVSQDDLA